MPRKETYAGPLSAQAQQDLVSEGIENFELPKSVVMKIAKSSIPDNVKLQKETVLSLVKGSTVFINYLAATAHDVAQSKQHKSISASDVLKALESIEFSDMVNKLQGELTLYRDLSKNDKGGRKAPNGGSAGPSRKAPAGASSASAPPKTKGKERVSTGNPFPPPFTSAPLDVAAANHMGAPMDVDDGAGESASFVARDAVNGQAAWDGDVADEAPDEEAEPYFNESEELEDFTESEELVDDEPQEEMGSHLPEPEPSVSMMDE